MIRAAESGEVADVSRHAERIEALLAEAERIEERLSEWQAHEVPDSSELRSGKRAYEDWYATAQRFVPEGEAATFKDMYEGGSVIVRIRGFLSDPLEVNPFWEPDTRNPILAKFQRPFNSTFKENFDRQQGILAMALKNETAIVNVLDDLATLCTRIPEYLAVFEQRGNEHVPAPSIENESDLQIVVEAILRLHFADVRPEDYVPEHAGGRSRVDFLLQESGVIIETKMTRDQLRDRKVGEELAIDFKRYEKHPDCCAIFALVYDPGRYLVNAAGLERDLTQTNSEPAIKTIVVR